MQSHEETILNISQDLQKNYRLEELVENFQKFYNFLPVFGVEIEFYLSEFVDIEKFSKLIEFKLSKESGVRQYEIELEPCASLLNYIRKISSTKSILTEIANFCGGTINFSPKPYEQDFGSALHFHTNLLCGLSNWNKNTMHRAASSICNDMMSTFLVFAPKHEDYKRFDPSFMAPSNISFGNNNRSVALRVPASYPKRIEHRIASNNTDLYLAFFTILKSIFKSLDPKCLVEDVKQIYGNAFDPQYQCIAFPTNPDESLRYFNKEFFFE